MVVSSLVIAVLGALALELGARAWTWIRGEPYDSAAARREALQILELSHELLPRGERGASSDSRGEHERNDAQDSRGDSVLHPYLGWEVTAGAAELEQEYERLRGGRCAGETEILLVGGSVAADFGADPKGWARVRETLATDARLAGVDLHALKLGRAGFKEPQQLNFVLYLLALGFKPAAVINIDGFAEVALGNENESGGSHPVFPSAAHWAHLAAWSISDRGSIDRVTEIRSGQSAIEDWASLIADRRLDRSCLLGEIALHRMRELYRASLDRFHAYEKYLADRDNGLSLHGPLLEGGEPEALNTSVRCWKESSRCLSDICRARGIIYIHVLQPTMHDEGSKPLTAGEIECGKASKSWIDGVELGYPRLREEGRALRELGVDFIDASRIFGTRRDDLYVDSCRFRSAGDEMLGDLIAAELARRWVEKK
jgi:hypothetical protein